MEEVAILVAKLYGAVALAMGLGFLINASYYKKVFVEATKDNVYILLGGIAALTIGILIVLNHNVWEASWVILVTIIGWIAIVKGALLLILPKSAGLFASWFENKSFVTAAGVGSLILGGILCYFGFLV
ncbi:hypothetical protein ACFL2V_15185 [Pseudomonadota bacterium]